MFLLAVLCVALLSTRFSKLVAGHGYVHGVVVDGQEYSGWLPFSDNYLTPSPSRIVRKISDDGFVPDGDADLPCHHGGNAGAGLVADVSAGSTITFHWNYWPADHQGPVSTYMASCNGDCTTFSASDGRWFKLDAAGYDTTTQLWAADLLRANNYSWTSTIPAKLAPGQYLVRNEIVALHSITPQFYPSCSQVNVKGTGTGEPPQSDTVSIPGLYSGAVWPKSIYSDFGAFAIPGPPPVSFDTTGGSLTSTTTASSRTTTTARTASQAGQPTSSAMNAGQTQCHLRVLSRRRLARRSILS